jgi:ferredoxin
MTQGKNMPKEVLQDERLWKVSIKPSGLAFDAKPNTSLLTAALQAQIRMPSSCRNGTCRTCLCILAEGQIRYQIDWPGLSAEEKVEGYILPCVAVAESDLVLEQPDAVSLA